MALRFNGWKVCSKAPVNVTASGLTGAAWASLGKEFKSISEEKFLSPSPIGFLSSRATTDIRAAEDVLQEMVAHNAKMYDGIDVRDPATLKMYNGPKPTWMTLGAQVRAVSDFIGGHLAHHVALEQWKGLFDLQYVEMDLMYWLYVLHLHMVSRRATMVRIELWNRRREVLDELVEAMFESWSQTAEQVMGRPPLNKIRQYIRDMYFVCAVNLEEALQHDGPGADLMLFAFLVKFCPLPRPEDVPMYTYYRLVHYVRFHTALLDRIPDEMIAKGNFSFLPPDDPVIGKNYEEMDFDRIIHAWAASDSKESQSTQS